MHKQHVKTTIMKRGGKDEYLIKPTVMNSHSYKTLDITRK